MHFLGFHGVENEMKDLVDTYKKKVFHVGIHVNGGQSSHCCCDDLSNMREFI